MHYLRTGTRRPDPPLAQQLETVLQHYEDVLLHYGRDTGVRMARKHLAWYSKGMLGSAEFRSEIHRQEDPERVRELLRTFYSPQIERQAA
jgi:tRNA-dihydrouridine synthase B